MLDNNIDEKDRIRNRYFRPRKTSIFHSRKKRENRYLEFEEHKPKTYKYYIYIYICVFDCGGCFSPIFWGLPYFSAPGAWAKLSKFLCLLSRSLSLSLRSLRLPVPCPSLVCCSLKQTRNGYVINKHRSVNLFWFLGRMILHFHTP